MEIDEDIYSNLPNNESHLLEEVEKLQQQNNLLQELIDSLETDIEKLCTKITDMKTIQDTLTKNISELYKTAKAELERKDRTIAELRSQLDEYLFRRRSAPIKRERDNSPSVGRPSVDPSAKKMRYENDENLAKRTFQRRSRSRSRSNERSKMLPRDRSSDRNWRDNRNDRFKYDPDCRRTSARDDKYGDRNYRNNSRREYNSRENHRYPTEVRNAVEKQHTSSTRENHQNSIRDTVEKRNVENIQEKVRVKDVTYPEKNEENNLINKNETEIPAKRMKNDENLKNNESDNKKKKNTNIEAVTEKLKKRLHQDQPKAPEENNTVGLKLSDIVEFMNQPEEIENEANKQIKEIVKNSKFVVMDDEIKEIIDFGTITKTGSQENNPRAEKFPNVYSDEKEKEELTKAPQSTEEVSQHGGNVSKEQNNNEDKREEKTYIDEKCNIREYAKEENPKTINPHRKTEKSPKSSKTDTKDKNREKRKQSSKHRSGEKIEKEKSVPFQNEEKSEIFAPSYLKDIENKCTVHEDTAREDVVLNIGETVVKNIEKIETKIKEIANIQDPTRKNEKHQEEAVPKGNVIVTKNIKKFETKDENTPRENEKSVAKTSSKNGNNLTQNRNGVQEVERNKQEKSVLDEDEENPKTINSHKISDKSLKSNKTDSKDKNREKRRESSKYKDGEKMKKESNVPTQNEEKSVKLASSDIKQIENKHTAHEDTSKEDVVPNIGETDVNNIEKIGTKIKEVTNNQDSSRENEKHEEETVPKSSELASKNIETFEIKNNDSRENVAKTSSMNENTVTQNESDVHQVDKNKQGKSVVDKGNPPKKSDKSPKSSKTNTKGKEKRQESTKHRLGEKIKKETSVLTQNEEKSVIFASSDLKEIENKHAEHKDTSKEAVVPSIGQNVLKNIEEVETKSNKVTDDRYTSRENEKHNGEEISTKSKEVIPKNIEKFEAKNDDISIENEKKNAAETSSKNENSATQNENDVQEVEKNKQAQSVLDTNKENPKTNNPHKKSNKSPKSSKANNKEKEKRKDSSKYRHSEKSKKEKCVPTQNEEKSEKFVSSYAKEIANKHTVHENTSKDVVSYIGENVLKNIDRIETKDKEVADDQDAFRQIEEHNAEETVAKTSSKNENGVGEDEKNKQEESVLDEEKSKRIKEKLAKLSSKQKEDMSIEDQKKKSILDEEKIKSVKVQLEKLSSKKSTRTENKAAPRTLISPRNDNHDEKPTMTENKTKKSKETKKDDSGDSLVIEESDRVLRSATRRNNSKEEEKKKKLETNQKEIEISLNLEPSDFSIMNLSHDEIPVLHISEDGENSFFNSSNSENNPVNAQRVLNTSSGRKRRRVVMTMID